MSTGEQVIGKPVDRVEGRLKVTGRARYTGEVPVTGVTYGVLVLSTIARGRITDFDVSDPTVAGRAAPGYELRIVDENDEDVPPGEAGELVLRTAEPWTTMIAYHGDPDATAHAFRNLWLHSGDSLRRDADGTFHFVDRLKDAIRRRGENIPSFEVEREVNAFPGVLESAAFAVPSPHTEDEVAVCVVARDGAALDVEALRAFLESRMPRFMLPGVIEVVPELPKTMTGKVKKYELRERVANAR